MKMPEFWRYKQGLSLLLWPISLLYCAVSALDLWLKKRKQQQYAVPVIVIGNITVGGTGKTPLIVALVEQLTAQGLKVGVVSRGYGADIGKQAIEVSPQSQPYEVGDEPLLIYLKTKVPIFVHPRRNLAVQALLAQHPVDVILSDDGLQHLQMGRMMEIAVIDGVRGLGNGFCLPAGPLRERATRLASVDAVVVNGKSNIDYAKKQFFMCLKATYAYNLATGEGAPLAAFDGQTVHAVAGIGNPARFFNTLKQAGIAYIPHAFDDHQIYRNEDLVFEDRIPVFMTEKDAVKCATFEREDFWVVAVEAQIDTRLVDKILESIDG